MANIKIQEIKAKSIITKTNLPEGDFVINPYVGCMHGCKYCYARFMKRFTNHPEPWGKFVDVKINAEELIPEGSQKYRNKFITISSVCDPYQPIEVKYKLTRKILEKLIPFQPHLDIITKSDLVVRDIDLLKQFKDCVVALSISTLDDNMRKKIEPFASSVKQRIATLRKLRKMKIKTALFISPIFPKLTAWKKIIQKTKNFVDEYWLENLNLYPNIKENIYGFLKEFNLELIPEYQKIYAKNSNYWEKEKIVIEKFCKSANIKYKIYFHH